MTDLNVSNTNTVDTIVEIILDKSGSMGSIRESTLEGLNAYINTLKKEQAANTMVGLTQFSSGWRNESNLTRTFFKRVEDLSELTLSDYAPDGGTPLYSSVNTIVGELEAKLVPLDRKPNVLLVIVTDGQDTTHDFSAQQQAKATLSRLQEEGSGWTVIYLGADHDSWAAGSSLGLHAANVMSYDKSAIGKTFGSIARGTAAYATASTVAASGGSEYMTKSFFADAQLSEQDFKDDTK